MNFLDEFQVMVRKYPQRAALADCNGERITTYEELNTLSGRIAAKLVQSGITPGRTVMVCMGRRMEYVAAEIGILMCGAAFVPVLPEYPKERIRFIEEDCQAAAMVTEAWLADIGDYAPAEPVAVSGKDRAMVIYTSGSTGTPKGIVHSMASITQAARRSRGVINLNEDDVLGATAPMSFIILSLEYLSVLSGGACTHILPEDVRRDVRLLEDYFAQKEITCAFISPQMLRFYKNKDKALKKIFTGSERVSMLAGNGYELYNLYGCSETAGLASWYKIVEKMENTPIGKPVEGVAFFLLDEEGREVAEGEEGELCIQGTLADEYLNLKEQSARTFIRQEDGTVLLHTGDIAKRLPDGNYLYVNRKDWMVKINGQRVETGEIEQRMASMPEVENAVVKAFEDDNGQNYLCAYYVQGKEVEAEQIRDHLKRTLPDYMVPRFFKRLDSLPKNANGKLDRMALLPPGLEEYKAAYREPENETERSICRGFEEILHCGAVGADDDFFKLGGDSINVLKLAGYLQSLALTPEMVLAGRTPKNIAGLLAEGQEGRGAHISKEIEGQDKRKLAVYEEGAEYPLTDSQMGVYLECVNEPKATMYNIPMCCELPAGLDRERFVDAVKKAVAMHPAFGVNIALSEGTPVMRMHPQYLEAEVGGGATEDIEEVKRSFVRPFTLEEGPLYRMVLYHDANHCYFLFDVHHIIFDGTSAEVFLEEISQLYAGGQPKAEEVSLMDLSAYEGALKETPRYQAARKYFEGKLAGEDFGDALIKDYKKKEVSVKSGEIKLALGEEFSCMAVEQFTRQMGISENTLFLGTFAYALGKYSGENKSLFCTVNNGRHTVDMANSVGMFVRTLPIYQSWEESSTVEGYLQGVQEDFYQVMGHDCISFGELARDYGIASDIIFVYQGEMFRGMALDGGQYAAEPLPTGDVQADVSMMVVKSRQGYEVSLEYREDLYREETARGLLGMFSQALKGMMSCKGLAQISLASELDIQVLDRFNETDKPFDKSKTVIDLFREQAKKTPEQTAVVYSGRSYTYAQADEITDRLAAYIAGLDIGREDVVSVLIPRCEFMALASLGVSKAGAAYQPLDPSYPPERLQFMIEDADAKLLIADEGLLPLVPQWQGRVLLTKDILSLPRAGQVPEPPKPEDLFILLYTSGSTGVPKGCMVEHRNIAAFSAWDREYYQLSEESRVAAYASYGFDACMQDIYPTLTAGATLHIIDESIRLDLNALNQYFMEQGITHSAMTTQIGRTFATSIKNDKLKYLSMGGEALTPFVPEGSTKYVNLYGPTEGTILVTAYQVREYEDNLPLGKAISNVKLYIIDSLGRRVPVGVPGELCIAGPQVTRGYLNRPEKTKEAYSDNPFSSREGFDRLYHTGDIVRYLPDGNIQFIGRRDGQVKIRGFRIELTEVEEVIRRFPGIKDATVAAFTEQSGGKYIAAYVVSDETVDVEAMNAFIEESKPPYMVPAVTMQIDKIPLNQNQKVNKRALPVPERKKEEMVAPQGETQQKIFDCVAEVVGHQEFGATTDIYKAGLTSIGAVKLNVLLSNAFEGAVIRNKDLKEHNTVEKLEQLLKEGSHLQTFERQELYPLTQTQNGVFVECAANPESTIYNIPFLFRLGENVDLQRLKRAIEKAVEAHPYIKTTVYMDESRDIWLKRNDDAPFTLEVSDCLDRENLVKPYQLLGDRLFRIRLYDTAEGKYLFMEFHHIISDGTSCNIFIEDMNKAYAGERLDAEKFSGFEVSLEEQRALQGEEYQRAKEYYDSIFKDCDTDFLLMKDLGAGEPGAGYYAKDIAVDMEAVQAFCAKRQITLNVLFTAAFGFVTGRYACREEAVFTTIYNGRNDSRLARTINMLVKTLPVYCRIDGKQSIEKYLEETKEQLLDSMNADIYSFAEISHAYGIKADMLLAFQGDEFQFEEIAGEKVEMEQLSLDAAKAPLCLNVSIKGDVISYQAEYYRDLFEERTVAGFLDMLTMVINEFLHKGILGEVCMADEKALRELEGFNGTEEQYDREKTVIGLFREQALRTPEHTAVVYADRSYTYAQVDEMTDRLAAYIAGLGIGREDVVSVLIPRCEYMALASLGVSKAGAAYQPLDPSYPKERLAFMMEDSAAKLLIADEGLLPLVPEWKGKVLLTKDIPGLPGAEQIPEPPKPEDLFILLYTSGSTGVPKGCMLEHRNIAAFCDWYKKFYQLSEESRVAAYASYGFDANMMDMYPALTTGAGVCIIEESIRLDLNALNQYFLAQGITHSFMTTQIGRAFATSMKGAQLKYLSMGGEALVPFEPEGSAKYVNIYGPTECTVNVTAYRLKEYEKELPIGKAISNVKLYILDSMGNRLPVGVPGELCIAGPQVSRGYLNRPEKTAEVYADNPYSDLPEYSRIYHTGDIVRYLPDGNIQFIGRRDGQVKIRGFRIELTEVEEIIRRFPGIKDATVAAFDEPSGGKYIAAYVVADEEVDVDALHAFIEESKPPYMVPAVTMQIDKIPLNQNQKVNKRALPMPERKQEDLVMPEGEAQQKIFDCVAEVIGHREFGINTDIYKAGLTSIGAVKLNVLLSDAFAGAVIRNKDLKEHDTVEKLEKFLANSSQEETFAEQETYPLTQTQNGIFVECAANPGSTIYNIPFLFRLGENVDLQRLKKAIEETVEAHSYIKTTLMLDDDGDIRQKRNDALPFAVEISGELHKEELVKPYQILGDRLFRIQLFDTPEGKYLFLEFHHIISDGESCGIFLRDMNEAYGGKSPMKEKFSGYEVALVEQKALQGQEYALAKQYYDSIFAGCDTDFLPNKDHREETPGLGVYQRADETDMEALRRFCTEQKITLNTLFTAAFGFVTGRYVYKDESVFTTIYNGRNDSRLSSTINMLVKTLPVYCSLDGEKEIRSYLNETGEQLMNSMNADIYSFAEISRAYNIKADIMFAFQGDNFRFEEIAGEKAVSEQLSLDTAKAPLSIDVLIGGNEVCYQVEYRSDMYEERTIAGLIDSLACVVREFQTKKQLKEVCMVSDKARRELDSYNQTEHAVEQTTANVLFERQAELYPDKTAVIACGKSLTFRELNENANKIANHLITMGLSIEQMVGVMLPRTVDVYAARQGILKAGGAFLPIDPEYPDERISYILEDSRAEFVLMPGELARERKMLIDKLSAKVLILEELLAEDGNIENPKVDIKPENLCYCIYTSGSTGKPKGVMIEHRNLVNYVDDNPYNVEAQSYVYNATVSLAFAAITFDVSILEECIPLYHGITACMANEEEIHNPLALSKLILENGVDMMTCTPSFLINIIDMPEMKKALSQIKVFNVGAEAFPEALYDKIMALGTNAITFNGYGPTETTIGCAFDQVTGDKITIGKPMANIKMVMIDKNRNLLPAGVPGELLIIGDGVGRGYVGKPEMTADKFIQFEGMNAYRSGDLAKWNHHGKIEFMGRMDNQVKLRGLRVELDEIENVMNQYPTVKSSVVLVKEKDSNQFLCGYFVAESQVEKQNLTCFMQKYLTPYMVPSVLMQLPELPLTNNGKVNKRALPEPEYTVENKNYVKPRTKLQGKLCEIFEMALGVEQIGIEDDFFENGGTSLSASKVAMKCMSAGIPVSYADLFDYKTPLELERHIQEVQGESAAAEGDGESKEGQSSLEQVLSRNVVEHVDEIAPSALGNVLLTGANGFLGAHILKNMIDNEDNTIYCLMRKGKASTLEKRLKSMLVYYFSNPYEELFGNRIQLIEGDITDAAKVASLEQYDFERVINCAACVKHFSADDTLEQVNYQGVLNLIRLCETTGRELIQISTVSIAGENVGGKFPQEKKLYEHELYFGQSLSNKYIDTKFRAEKAVLEAAAQGMKGKVIRVGNLMSRVSDGEFQINSVTNGFMRTLRGYVALGRFPVSMLDMPTEFSPIDSTAEAIVKLSSVQGEFTVFHAYSSYLIQMADVIAQMNESGILVETVSDEEFQQSLLAALEDEEKNELISGLIAYASSDADNSTVYIDADNSFTTKALYRLGFKWPMPDSVYLKNALTALETLGFFDGRL